MFPRRFGQTGAIVLTEPTGGDRHDYGVLMMRPDVVERKSRGRLLHSMTIIVNDADRERVEYIVADYGTYPEKHEVIYTP